MKPTLRQLEAFVQVYRLGSLTRAAQAMHLTQSAMSVLVQQLEEALGVRLFDRGSRHLQPTAAARDVLRRAEAILAEAEALAQDARDLAGLRRGELHVGVATAVAASILPAVMQRFVAAFPDVRLHVHDAGPERLLAPVLEGEVEFSIGTPQARHPGLRFTTLLQDPLAAVCTPDSALARQATVSWQQLAQFPIITVNPGNGIRSVIDQACQEAGVFVAPAWEVSYLSTALALTRAGLGVSVLPAYLIAALGDPGLVTRPLDDPIVCRTLYLIEPRDRQLGPAASELVALFQAALCGGDTAAAARRPA